MSIPLIFFITRRGIVNLPHQWGGGGGGINGIAL